MYYYYYYYYLVLVLVLVLFIISFIFIYTYKVKRHNIELYKPFLVDKPYMGWNSWSSFGPNITEKLIIEMVDIIADGPLKEAGYTYVIIDDGWALDTRDKNGFLQADPVKFPNGLKYLSNYIRSKGLKMGIYTSAGSKTCNGYVGSKNYEEQDAYFFKDLSVNLVKNDFCGFSETFYKFWPWSQYQNNYAKMAKHLYDTSEFPYYKNEGIIYNICNWGFGQTETWAPDISHSWRIDFDIRPSWNSIMRIFDRALELRSLNGPNQLNDPDMLVLGVEYFLDKLSDIENITHFCLWVMLSGPLILSCDLRRLNNIDLITNKEIISINQDPLCLCCYSVFFKNNKQILVKKLINNRFCVAFLNRSRRPLDISYDLLNLKNDVKNVRALISRSDVLVVNGLINRQIPGHGIEMFLI